MAPNNRNNNERNRWRYEKHPRVLVTVLERRCTHGSSPCFSLLLFFTFSAGDFCALKRPTRILIIIILEKAGAPSCCVFKYQSVGIKPPKVFFSLVSGIDKKSYICPCRTFKPDDEESRFTSACWERSFYCLPSNQILFIN